MLATGLLLAAGSLATPSKDAMRERLEALIEQTNALEHFHVEFEATRGDSIGFLILDYRAPGQLQIRGESEKGTMDSGYSERVMWLSADRREFGLHWFHFDLDDRGGEFEEIVDVLRGKFWRTDDGPEVSVEISWELNQDNGRLEPSVSLSHATVGNFDHYALLGWLHHLHHQASGSFEVEDEELVYREDGVLCRVDLESGFLTELTLTSEDGSLARLTLKELDLDEGPAGDAFEIPNPLEGSEDHSQEMRSAMFSRGLMRQQALDHVHGIVRKGRRLDSEIHDELERFLVALYGPPISARHASWLAETRTYAVGLADWIREQLAQGRPEEEVRAHVDDHRASMEDHLRTQRQSWRDAIPADPEDRSDSDAWRAIRELEDDVLDARFEALVTRPMLDDFDARVDEALEG